MRQSLISIGDDFWIENMRGQRMFRINGKVLTLANTLVFETPRGDPLCQIQSRILTIRRTMDIERYRSHGPPFATVKKDLINLVRDEYDVDVAGKPPLRVRGNILDHEYKVLGQGGRTVAEISKRWLALVDTYVIDIDDDNDDYEDWLILAICVAVDQMSHDKRVDETPGVHTVSQGNHLGGAVAAGVGQAVVNNPVAGAVAVGAATGSVTAGIVTAAVATSAQQQQQQQQQAPPQPYYPPPPRPPPVAPVPAALPPGWIQQQDPASGAWFFVDTTRGFTTWDDPRTAAVETGPLPPAPVAPPPQPVYAPPPPVAVPPPQQTYAPAAPPPQQAYAPPPGPPPKQKPGLVATIAKGALVNAALGGKGGVGAALVTGSVLNAAQRK
ncbi:tubby C-terminal-like domain-containing protein [Hyaloraphidium curvatum]|nr:tubby C-terminal-like domain-containing protein [Hyaloraphidium curvatum]